MRQSQSASVLLNRLLARGKFRHVQVLLKLAELGSVQRTAEAIGMTQSSVTQTLANLEELLDIQLFQRHSRGVRPAAACVDLLPVLRQMYRGVAESSEIVIARRDKDEAVVRLLASAAAINGILIHALPEFSSAVPDVRVQLREAENDDLLLAIARSEVDIVVCRAPTVVPQGWNFQPLMDDSLAVVCAANHRLARRRRIAWSEAHKERWLLSPTGSIARTAFDDFAQHFPAGPKLYPLVTRVFSISVDLLWKEQLLALFPHSFVKHLTDCGDLAVLPLNDIPAMAALGVLVPEDSVGAAPAALASFLRSRAS